MERKEIQSVYVGKVVKRFLVDENGPVESVLVRCLKPKSGSSTILGDTPSHLLADESLFTWQDFVAGPLEVIQKGSKNFEVTSYQEQKLQFQELSKIDLTTF